jgi:hypothetical protein
MADPATIGAVVVSIISAVGALIASWHIRKCKNPACEIDCSKDPNSPRNSIKKTDSGKL